jgi:hypothetical protein
LASAGSRQASILVPAASWYQSGNPFEGLTADTDPAALAGAAEATTPAKVRGIRAMASRQLRKRLVRRPADVDLRSAFDVEG